MTLPSRVVSTSGTRAVYGHAIHGLLAAGFQSVDQHYLLQARQMQALSLAVHIPLVCFGIAFPALVLFVEWLGIRTGDPVYRTLARRWSRVMISLFAVGVVTGTILSFEFGLLWPAWMAKFGDVFGFAFALEGFSFFLEAIFIGIYVYGWDRLSPRVHLLTGIPIAITGLTGSLMVIAVNGWMNHPTGSDHAGRPGHRRASVRRALRQLVLLARVRAHVPRRVHGRRLRRRRRLRVGRLRGRWGRYERIALAIPLDGRRAGRTGADRRRRLDGARGRRATSRSSSPRSRGSHRRPRARPSTSSGWYDGTARSSTASRSRDLLSLLAYHARTRPCRASTRSRRTTGRR